MAVNHKSLKDELAPIQVLEGDVRRKALMRLEYEGLLKCEAVTTPGARYYDNPAGFAMNRYAYYVCFKCKKVSLALIDAQRVQSCYDDQFMCWP